MPWFLLVLLAPFFSSDLRASEWDSKDRAFLACAVSSPESSSELALADLSLALGLAEARVQDRLLGLEKLTQRKPAPGSEELRSALIAVYGQSQGDLKVLQDQSFFKRADRSSPELKATYTAESSRMLSELAQKLAMIQAVGTKPGNGSVRFFLDEAKRQAESAGAAVLSLNSAERAERLPGLLARVAHTELASVSSRDLLDPPRKGSRTPEPVVQMKEIFDRYRARSTPGSESLELGISATEVALESASQPGIPGDYGRAMNLGVAGAQALASLRGQLTRDVQKTRELGHEPERVREARILDQVAGIELASPEQNEKALSELKKDLVSTDPARVEQASEVVKRSWQRSHSTQVAQKFADLMVKVERETGKTPEWVNPLRKEEDQREAEFNQSLKTLVGGQKNVDHLGLSSLRELKRSDDPVLAHTQRSFLEWQARVGELLEKRKTDPGSVTDQKLQQAFSSADLAWMSLQCHRLSQKGSIPPILVLDRTTPNGTFSRVDFEACRNAQGSKLLETSRDVAYRAIDRKRNVAIAWEVGGAAVDAGIALSTLGVGSLVEVGVKRAAIAGGEKLLAMGVRQGVVDLAVKGGTALGKEAIAAVFEGTATGLKNYLFLGARTGNWDPALLGKQFTASGALERAVLATTKMVVNAGLKGVFKREPGTARRFFYEPFSERIADASGEMAVSLLCGKGASLGAQGLGVLDGRNWIQGVPAALAKTLRGDALTTRYFGGSFLSAVVRPPGQDLAFDAALQKRLECLPQ